jgi:hypothetical protein
MVPKIADGLNTVLLFISSLFDRTMAKNRPPDGIQTGQPAVQIFKGSESYFYG